MTYLILHYALNFLLVGFTAYLLIYYPQQKHARLNKIISENLQPGAFVTTTKNISGTVLAIYPHTLVIQKTSGEKVEILKQTLVTAQAPVPHEVR